MSKKRMLTTVASLGLAASLVAACGSGGSGTGGGSGGQTNADGTTPVEMWVFAELHAEYYEQMAEQWNETNPDEQIDLNVIVYPYQDMHNKLQLAANSGQGMPDVVDIEVNKFANFVKGSNPPLYDLTQAAEPYADDIVQARLDLYSRDGKLYAYPTHVGAFVSFYNTELLEGAGIDYTTIETWEDFEAAGVAYNEATGKAFGVASTSVFFQEPLMVAQLGGQIFEDGGTGAVSIDTPEMTQVMEQMAGMEAAGAISTIPGASPDDEEAFGAINRGDYAAIVYPAWYTSRFVDYMPDLSGKIAIAPAPAPADAEVVTIGGGGTGAAVAKDSPVAELAADWLAFAKLSPEGNVAVWEILGFDPVNMSVWEDTAVTQDPENKFNQYFTTNLFDVLNEVKGGIGHFESFANPNLPAVDNQFRTVTLNQVYENGADPAQALADSQSDLRNELGE